MKLIWYTRFCRKYGACRQVVKTSDCGSDMHGFESHQAPHISKSTPLLGVFLLVALGSNRSAFALLKNAQWFAFFCGRVIRRPIYQNQLPYWEFFCWSPSGTIAPLLPLYIVLQVENFRLQNENLTLEMRILDN